MSKSTVLTTLPPRVVIRASAGTGKTYRLTGHYLQLLVDGVAPRNILATTFTRKAAGEIFDRILLRLAEAAVSDANCQKLATAIDRPSLSRPKCQQLFVDTLAQLDTLQVGTLDSFFARIATALALELSLPLGWSICEPEEDVRMRREAIEAVLDTENTSDLLTLVNLLTKGEARRGVSDLVLDTVNSLYTLYRETSRDAWQKVPQLARVSSTEVAQAIDAIGQLVFDDKRFAKARAGDLAAIAVEDWDTLLSKGIAGKVAAGEWKFYGKEIQPEVIALYRTLTQHAASQLVSQVARQTEATWQLLDHFAGTYQRLQRDQRSLRFDDITQQLASGLASTSQDQWTARLGTNIEHLLLDEFQDTSLTQWRVLMPIALAMLAKHPAASLLCVGDVKQAIYGWRGGLASIFAAVKEQLPGISSEELATSYRCSQPVIDCVNHVFKQLLHHDNLETLHDAAKLWQENFPEHSTARKELSGYVALVVAPEAVDDEKAKSVTIRHAADLVARLSRQHPDRSIGVLVRKNDTVAEMMLLLRQRSVAASEEGGNALCDSAPVEIILSALRLAEHPGDSVARFHLAHSPLAASIGISADQFTDHALAAEISAKLRRNLLEQGYGNVILGWAKQLAPHCDPRDEARLSQLVEMAFQLGTTPSLRIQRLIEIIETRRISDPAATKVRVMTVHQSKGLEFDIVVLPELDEKLTGQTPMFVTGRSTPYGPVDVVCRYANKQVQQQLGKMLEALFRAQTEASVTESLCVLYVAMTRAIHAMFMVVQPSEKSSGFSKDYAGLLQATIGGGRPLAHDSIAYTIGDDSWLGEHEEPAIDADDRAIDSTVELEPAITVSLAEKASFPQRLVDRVSPSQLEGGPKVRIDYLLGPADQTALNYGLLMHAWMEQIEWIDAGPPADSSLASSPAAIGLSSTDIAKAMAQFREHLAKPATIAALSRSRYLAQFPGAQLTVLREHKFAVRDGNQLLTGSIDRAVVCRIGGKLVGAEIIDFKTDIVIDEIAIAQRTQHYTPQLQAYRRALASLFHVEESSITLALAFLRAGKVVAIT